MNRLIFLLVMPLLLCASVAVAAEGKALFERGVAEYGKKDYFVSILTFRKFIQENPDAPDRLEAAKLLARSYTAVGNEAAAGEVIRETLSWSPNSREKLGPDLLALAAAKPKKPVPLPPRKDTTTAKKPAKTPDKTTPVPKNAKGKKETPPTKTPETAPVLPPLQQEKAPGQPPANSPAAVPAAPPAATTTPHPETGAERAPKNGRRVYRLLIAQYADGNEARQACARLRETLPTAFVAFADGVFSLYASSFDSRPRAEREQGQLGEEGIPTEIVESIIPSSR